MESAKGKGISPLPNSPMEYTSSTITRAHSPELSNAIHAQKPKACHTFKRDRVQLPMLSDPLDSTSSDEMSFNEEDMYGSDPDVETISLGSASNTKVQSSDEDLVSVLSG